MLTQQTDSLTADVMIRHRIDEFNSRASYLTKMTFETISLLAFFKWNSLTGIMVKMGTH